MTRRLWLWPLLGALGVLAVLWALGRAGTHETTALKPEIPSRAAASASSDRFRVSVVARYPHDTGAFTQGLLWHAGKVYETTGEFGRSRLRRWDLETGKIEQETRLAADLFGEGLALVQPTAGPEGESGVARSGASLIWLSWHAGRAFRFSLDDFASLGEFSYPGQGWGLTLCDGTLFRSDGTGTLWRHDPQTFEIVGRVEVTRDGAPVRDLNELECTPRGLLANIWQADEIVQIDSRNGRVTATVDAGGLLGAHERPPEGVLNGIAYRPETDTLLLTGKHWPWLFEVVLEPAP